MYGLKVSGWQRWGLASTAEIKVSNMVLHSSVQEKGWSFLVSAMSGRAMSAYCGMKGL